MRSPWLTTSNTSERNRSGLPCGRPARARSAAMTASSRSSDGKCSRKLARRASSRRPEVTIWSATSASASSHRPMVRRATPLLIPCLVRPSFTLLSGLLALTRPHRLDQRAHQPPPVDLLAPNDFQPDVMFAHDPLLSWRRCRHACNKHAYNKMARRQSPELISIVVESIQQVNEKISSQNFTATSVG